ncbi:unnamed protein product [Heterobilharzia americana]|nr:unnamed protein product [Heterobilharzia americana]CAH8471281.1 unnamed protein product [Heterobilharzia americana]
MSVGCDDKDCKWQTCMCNPTNYPIAASIISAYIKNTLTYPAATHKTQTQDKTQNHQNISSNKHTRKTRTYHLKTYQPTQETRHEVTISIAKTHNAHNPKTHAQQQQTQRQHHHHSQQQQQQQQPQYSKSHTRPNSRQTTCGLHIVPNKSQQ